MTEASVVVATKELATADLEGQAVILNLTSGLYHGLNAIGSRIWQLVQEPRTVSAIRDVLLEEYEVDAETCMRDLLAVLVEMRSAALVEVSDGGGA